MTSRRSFLLGIGALVSASFVTRVKAHVLEIARPLLLEPKRAEETLYLYEQSGWDDDWKWRVSLGPDDVHEPPPPPTWREHLRPLGYTFETKRKLDERAFGEMSLEPEDVDKHLDGYHQHHRLCAGGVSAPPSPAPRNGVGSLPQKSPRFWHGSRSRVQKSRSPPSRQRPQTGGCGQAVLRPPRALIRKIAARAW